MHYIPSRYAFDSEECYKSEKDFEALVDILKILSEDYDLNQNKDFLLIDIPEGRFIKAANRELCEQLTLITEHPEHKTSFKIVDESDFDDLTRKYRMPTKSFGNEKLARWKIGF